MLQNHEGTTLTIKAAAAQPTTPYGGSTYQIKHTHRKPLQVTAYTPDTANHTNPKRICLQHHMLAAPYACKHPSPVSQRRFYKPVFPDLLVKSTKLPDASSDQPSSAAHPSHSNETWSWCQRHPSPQDICMPTRKAPAIAACRGSHTCIPPNTTPNGVWWVCTMYVHPAHAPPQRLYSNSVG